MRICGPNLVMIGPAVWPPILDRQTHTHTQTEFVYRYRYISTNVVLRYGIFLLFYSSLSLEGREEQGFMVGLKIPAPWTSGKSIETVHPVRDNYKFKETVHIPGARCLYLRFDVRCSSQYDYDKASAFRGLKSLSIQYTSIAISKS